MTASGIFKLWILRAINVPSYIFGILCKMLVYNFKNPPFVKLCTNSPIIL